MAKKRFKSPLPEEIERIADDIYSDSRGRIVDRDTFDQHYDLWFGGQKLSEAQDTTMRDKVFNNMQSRYKNISKERLYKKAGGKDLKRDQRQTAQEVTTSPRRYKQRGADKIDMKGLDTKKVDKFTTTGKIKGRVVYCQRVRIHTKGKYYYRLRDRKGRFATPFEAKKKT